MILLLDTLGRGRRGHDPLLARLQDLVPTGDLKVLHALDSLFEEILQSLDEMFIVILRPVDQTDLADFKLIRGLLRNIRIILILPDDELETVALGHDLRPRYLVNNQNDFDGFVAVLDKMIHPRSGNFTLSPEKASTYRPFSKEAHTTPVPDQYPPRRHKKNTSSRLRPVFPGEPRFAWGWYGSC